MTILANSGSVVTIAAGGITLTDDGTIESGGLLQGAGTIAGPFDLIVQGFLDAVNGTLTIDTGTLTNQGGIFAMTGDVTIEPSVSIANLSNGTLTGGQWSALHGTLDFVGGTIATLDATINIDTNGAIVEQNPIGGGTQSIENSISVIGSSGILELPADDNTFFNWLSPGALLVQGTVLFDEGGANGQRTFAATGGISIASGGTFNANGAIASAVTVSGQLNATNPAPLNDTTFLDLTGAVSITSGGALTVADSSTFTAAGPVSGSGQITIAAKVSFDDTGGVLDLEASSSLAANIVNNGEVVLGVSTPGAPWDLSGTIAGDGTLEIQNGGTSTNTVEIANVTTSGIVFGGAVTGGDFAKLILDSPAAFSGQIDDFNNDSTIVLDGIVGNQATLNGTILSILDGGGTVDTLTLVPEPISVASFIHIFGTQGQDYSLASFVATPDTINGNTTITGSGIRDFNFAVTCFLPGTWIRVPSGSRRIEHLAVGDRVVTDLGGEQRIVWTGRREIDCGALPEPSCAWPVRIAPGAFGPGRPRRALYLSPDHAVQVDGVLIPVRYLINTTSIRQVAGDRVVYHHIELEEHDILFAEGLAVESYLDRGDRGLFTAPDATPKAWELMGCAPLVVTGPVLARTRAMLVQRSRDGATSFGG